MSTTRNLKSEELYNRACKVIPGGVNSPVRAFRNVGGTPRFISSGRGAYLVDADGNELLDYVGSWGPLVLGHRPEAVYQRLVQQLHQGWTYGAPTDLEVELAELITSSIEGVEMIRFVNSGTEATMSAVRLARAVTGRDRIVKVSGCYHGHADTFLVQAGSGVATLGLTDSPGVPTMFAELTACVEYNNLAHLEQLFADCKDIAALIVEPVAGNMGLVLPQDGYLQGCRDLCDKHGVVLIFDEVMSGFRVAFGGAIERYRVIPDLVTYGKVVGGGLPVGAFAGQRSLMQHIAPAGKVYQAGTLSGNPLAMVAGLETLKVLKELQPYTELELLANGLVEGLKKSARSYDIPFETAFCGSMFGFFFTNKPVHNFDQAKTASSELYRRFFHAMLERGTYFAPSPFETGFMSTAHTKEDISKTLCSAHEVFKELRQ